MFGFDLGASHSSQKSQSWIDPQTSAAQWGNLQGAQTGLQANYTPTSASQIQSYLSPYTQDVVNGSLQALGQANQIGLNQVGDSASAAHAFGGSRQGVAQALTNQSFGQQAGLLSSQLLNQGYGQALQTAQQENQYGYQYPLARQGLLNQTLAGITPHQYSKGSGTTISGDIKGQWGQS